MSLSLQEQIEQIVMKNKDYSNISFSGGKSLNDILLSEAERLKTIIGEEIDKYYAPEADASVTTYTPSVYKRYESNHLKKKLKIRVNKNKHTVTIYFDPHTSWGESYINHDPESGYIPLLIDQGWKVGEDVPFREIYMFGYYEGFHFIEKAIRRFNADNPYGLKVRVSSSYEGKEIRAYRNI